MFSNQNGSEPDDESSIDRLLRDVDAVKADIAKLSGEVGSVVNDLAEVARRKARRRYHRARSNVDALVTDATSCGRAALDAASHRWSRRGRPGIVVMGEVAIV